MTLDQQRAIAVARARRRRSEGGASAPETPAPINPRERAMATLAKPASEREQPSEAAMRSPLGNLEQGKAQSFGQGFADTGGWGFADELAAGPASLLSGQSYGDTLKEMRDIRAGAEEQNPGSYLGGQVTGAVAPFLLTRGAVGPSVLTGTAAKGAGLGGRMLAGAKAGALQGGVYGVGSGEGMEDRIAGGAGGAVSGAVLGGAIPAIATTVKTAAKPFIDPIKARMNPAAFATKKIEERLAAGKTTPGVISTKMANSAGNPSVADVAGKSARDLLRTAVNIPGPARDRVATQLALKQMGQGDRLLNAVRDTLADPDGYLTVKDRIAETMQKVSKPLYDAFENSGVPITRKLVDILKTPAGRGAFAKAKELVANEQDELFDGTGNLTSRAWNYLKIALDDMVGKQTDNITGKVTNEGRILNNLKNDLLAEIDRVNPHYKPAREAWGGVKQLDEALEFGKKALTMTDEQIRRQTKKFNPGQKMAMRVGVAEALRAAIAGPGVKFTDNAVLRVMAGKQRYNALRALFDNDKQFAEFRKVVFAEARKRKTYDAVRGNSTSVAQFMDAMEAGGTGDAVNFVGNAASSGIVNATLNWVGSRLRRLGGFTPQVADEVARKLMTTNPAKAGDLVKELSAIEAARLSSQQKASKIQALLSRVLTTQGVSAANAQ